MKLSSRAPEPPPPVQPTLKLFLQTTNELRITFVGGDHDGETVTITGQSAIVHDTILVLKHVMRGLMIKEAV
jgi:hypothetical protein